MQYTDNYQFREPTPAVDIVKVGDINYNSRKIDELIHSTQVSLAPAYDETRTSSNPYMTGDVVMKDALMYRCLDDDVYGAWDATKWERTTAGEEGAGGSSVEANPQGTPTDDLDTIGINGTIYNIAGSGGGGGNVYGAFVDTNRIIKASTSVASGTTDTYTATEDCAVHIVFVGSTNPSRAYIDGVEVETHYASQTAFVTHVLYIRRGQVFSLESGDNSTNYTVYGLTFGTQNIFTPQIYSTEERCVGVWVDNKPLYQKSVLFDNTSSTNLSIDVSSLDIDKLVECKVWNKNTGYQVNSYYDSGSDYINAYYDETGSVHIRRSGTAFAGEGYITIYYTKTTDTAGSGSYNTLGVPMVHYTTDEQVVGTWIDGKTLYQKTYHLASLTTSISVLDASVRAETLVGVWGSASDGDRQYNAPYAYSSDQIRVMLDSAGTWTTAGGLVAQASTNIFDSDIYLTIQYTKSSS